MKFEPMPNNFNDIAGRAFYPLCQPLIAFHIALCVSLSLGTRLVAPSNAEVLLILLAVFRIISLKLKCKHMVNSSRKVTPEYECIDRKE